MNLLQIARAVDDVATRDPKAFGYGYADTQFVWHHDPAIDHSRTAYLDFLTFVDERAPHGAVLQIGTAGRPATRLALQATGRRVVTVDVEANLTPTTTGAETSGRDLVVGEPTHPVVVAAVQARCPHAAILVLDHGDDYQTMREAWQAYAPLIVNGGIIAIVDRSQTLAGNLAGLNVDQFVADLERQFLVAHGTRLQRFGQASAIHCYVQGEGTRGDDTTPEPPSSVVLPAPTRALGSSGEFDLFAWRDQVIAIPHAEGPLRLQSLFRNDYPVVLVAPTRDDAGRLVAAFGDSEARLDEARRQLAQEQPQAAAAVVRSVLAAFPELPTQLAACLELVPWNRRLILALGTLDTFGECPRQGVLLLRRALAVEMVDAELLQAAATAFLQVLHDEEGARDLLLQAKKQVQKRRLATVCHTLPRGHLLWQYPQLLVGVRGVLQVGAHCGEDVPSWCQLAIPTQIYVEANPTAANELQRVCAEPGGGHKKVLTTAVGAETGTAQLHVGDRSARASLLPHHPLHRVADDERQRRRVSVPLTTLDTLVARGEIDARACNLLFVDTEGSELEVLRGATELLRHVDTISVGVFLHPVYNGVPMPQEIQTFLRELHDGDGFGLRAFEVGDDPARGQAVFRRLKERW